MSLVSSLLIFFCFAMALSGCVSDEERKWAYYETAHYSYLMVASGDSAGALRYLQRQVTKLPDAKTKQDSTYYANIVLRLAFLDYYADSTGALAATYYRHAYGFLRHLPEPARIDGLRYAALVLAQRGDTARALLYLYESRHRASAAEDDQRVAKADTCLSYLEPQELAMSAAPAWPIDTLIVVGLLIFLSTLAGTTWAVKHHHRPAAPEPGPEPEPEPEVPETPIRFLAGDPPST